MTSANVVYAILSTLKDAGDSPSGIIYAALMTKGISHDTYQGIINGLVQAKLIKVSYNQLMLTDMGKELVSKVDSDLAKRKAD